MTSSRYRLARRVIERLGLQREWYFVVVAALIGLIMGGVAMAFILPLRAIEEWSAEMDAALLIWLVPLAPIAGALLTGVVLRMMGEEGRNPPGVSTVMYAIHRRKSRMQLKIAGGKWLASTLTIGSGGSAGAEGPIVTIGSVIGSNIGRLLKTNPQNTATLLGCGAAAGIASVFNAPIAGIFFVLEVLLRDFSLRTFTPIVIAAVISSVVTQSVLGNDALFGTRSDFQVGAFAAIEIPNYLVLGVLCGIGAACFIRALGFTERCFAALRAPAILKPALGAAALGLLGLGWLQIVGAHRMPDFYGNGYPVIKELLDPARYFERGSALASPASAFLLIAMLCVLKAVATCLTLGSGGSGGLFAPSLLLGASLGGAFGYVVNWLNWFPAATPAHYALVGMAAMTAANLHAPLTAILMVYEITQSYAIILPLMLAAIISTIVTRLITPDSVYTRTLSRMGLRLGGHSDLTILRRLSVMDVPLAPAVLVHQDDSAQRLLELSEQHLVRDFVVVDDQELYVGIVTGADLSAALVYREAIPLLQVQELQRVDLPTVTRDETLDVVLDKFAQHDAQSLAVLDERSPGKIHGMITRARLMARYQMALDRD